MATPKSAEMLSFDGLQEPSESVPKNASLLSNNFACDVAGKPDCLDMLSTKSKVNIRKPNPAFESEELDKYMRDNFLEKESNGDDSENRAQQHREGNVGEPIKPSCSPPRLLMPVLPRCLQKVRTVAQRKKLLQKFSKNSKLMILNNEAIICRELRRKLRSVEPENLKQPALQDPNSQMPFSRIGWQAASFVATKDKRYHYQKMEVDQAREIVKLPGVRGNNKDGWKKAYSSYVPLSVESKCFANCPDKLNSLAFLVMTTPNRNRALRTAKASNQASNSAGAERRAANPALGQQERLSAEFQRSAATIMDASTLSENGLLKPSQMASCALECVCPTASEEHLPCGKATQIIRPNADGRSMSAPLHHNVAARLACMKKDASTTMLTNKKALLTNQTQSGKKRHCTEAPQSSHVDSASKLKVPIFVESTVLAQLKHCTVPIMRLTGTDNIACWCMVHKLYNCFCGGRAVQGKPMDIKREPVESLARPEVERMSIQKNEEKREMLSLTNRINVCAVLQAARTVDRSEFENSLQRSHVDDAPSTSAATTSSVRNFEGSASKAHEVNSPSPERVREVSIKSSTANATVPKDIKATDTPMTSQEALANTTKYSAADATSASATLSNVISAVDTSLVVVNASTKSGLEAQTQNVYVSKISDMLTRMMEDITSILNRKSKAIPDPSLYGNDLCLIKWSIFLDAFLAGQISVWEVRLQEDAILVATNSNTMPMFPSSFETKNILATEMNTLPLLGRMLRMHFQSNETNDLTVYMTGRHQYWFISRFLLHDSSAVCLKPTSKQISDAVRPSSATSAPDVDLTTSEQTATAGPTASSAIKQIKKLGLSSEQGVIKTQQRPPLELSQSQLKTYPRNQPVAAKSLPKDPAPPQPENQSALRTNYITQTQNDMEHGVCGHKPKVNSPVVELNVPAMGAITSSLSKSTATALNSPLGQTSQARRILTSRTTISAAQEVPAAQTKGNKHTSTVASLVSSSAKIPTSNTRTTSKHTSVPPKKASAMGQPVKRSASGTPKPAQREPFVNASGNIILLPPTTPQQLQSRISSPVVNASAVGPQQENIEIRNTSLQSNSTTHTSRAKAPRYSLLRVSSTALETTTKPMIDVNVSNFSDVVTAGTAASLVSATGAVSVVSGPEKRTTITGQKLTGRVSASSTRPKVQSDESTVGVVQSTPRLIGPPLHLPDGPQYGYICTNIPGVPRFVARCEKNGEFFVSSPDLGTVRFPDMSSACRSLNMHYRKTYQKVGPVIWKFLPQKSLSPEERTKLEHHLLEHPESLRKEPTKCANVALKDCLLGDQGAVAAPEPLNKANISGKASKTVIAAAAPHLAKNLPASIIVTRLSIDETRTSVAASSNARGKKAVAKSADPTDIIVIDDD